MSDVNFFGYGEVPIAGTGTVTITLANTAVDTTNGVDPSAVAVANLTLPAAPVPAATGSAPYQIASTMATGPAGRRVRFS